MISREALLTHIRPLAETLAVDLAALIAERLNGQLEQALDVARSALASDLARADAPGPATVKAHRDRANMLRREADAAEAARLPNPRRTATCRNCGRVGFTSKGCGTTHEPLTEPAAIVSPPPARAARAPAPAPSPIHPPALSVAEELEILEHQRKNSVVTVDPVVVDQDEDEDEIEAAPRPAPRDRFAKIEAAAQARRSA